MAEKGAQLGADGLNKGLDILNNTLDSPIIVLRTVSNEILRFLVKSFPADIQKSANKFFLITRAILAAFLFTTA